VGNCNKVVAKCTLCPKKTCDYILHNNFKNKCPATIIFWHRPTQYAVVSLCVIERWFHFPPHLSSVTALPCEMEEPVLSQNAPIDLHDLTRKWHSPIDCAQNRRNSSRSPAHVCLSNDVVRRQPVLILSSLLGYVGYALFVQREATAASAHCYRAE